ncbi:MAG TPA: YbhB/YbcL family Raf kinase inhibitor-like protein [Acidobacteriota bacterium]|nr:YbhB/YbcL family Raf kinase inhibitor-like protein [Acidobacteriota bacterium]
MRTVFLITAVILLAGCRTGQNQETPTVEQTGEEPMALTITSTAFAEGEMIPRKYTCDGDDISPPLTWSGAPDTTVSFVLICDDPDAPRGTWVHWVMYNIPADTTTLPENLPQDDTLAAGAVQGITDFRRPGYGGPCPPSGTHRYYFKLYALDTVLAVAGRATKDDLLAAMKGHVVAESQLMGRYSRQR